MTHRCRRALVFVSPVLVPEKKTYKITWNCYVSNMNRIQNSPVYDMNLVRLRKCFGPVNTFKSHQDNSNETLNIFVSSLIPSKVRVWIILEKHYSTIYTLQTPQVNSIKGNLKLKKYIVGHLGNHIDRAVANIAY